MYALKNIETGDVVFTSDNKSVFGGPWGALDAEGKPTHEWVEIVPTADEIKQEKFDAINAEYQPKLAKMRDTLATLQVNSLDTTKLKAAYAAMSAAYKAELAAVK